MYARACWSVPLGGSGRLDEADAVERRAIELAPEDALRYADLAWVAAG